MTSIAATTSGTASSSVTAKAPSSSFNEENLMRKLDQCTPSQESIQTLALWIIHHKNHHELITKLWLKKMAESNTTIKQRLTLFYLANDVIQNCKRKNAKIYQDSFKTVLNDAVANCRSESIKKNVQRVLEVWLERQVYDKQFIDQLLSTLNFKSDLVTRSPEPVQPKSTVDTSEIEKDEIERIIAEFQVKNLCDSIESFESFSKELIKEKTEIEATRIFDINFDHIRQYRDRSKCEKFKMEFETSSNKLDQYVLKLSEQLEKRRQLINLLKQSEIFYDAQYKDAKTVFNAYRSYGMKVHGVKKRLDQMMETKFSTSNKNLETMDMEMSDDEQNVSVSNCSQKTSNSLSQSSNGKNQVRANLDPRRQKKDEVKKRERSNTPVRDENPDYSSQSSNSPLDFLTKFINKSSNQSEATSTAQQSTTQSSNLSFIVNSLQKFVNNGNSSGYNQSNEFYNPSSISYQNSYMSQESNRPGTPTKDEVYQPPIMLGQPQAPSYSPMMVPAPPPPPPPPYQMYQPTMNMIPPPPMPVPGVPPNQLMIDPYQHQMPYHVPPPGYYPNQNKAHISPSGSSKSISPLLSQPPPAKSPKANRLERKNDVKSDTNYTQHKRPLLSNPIISPNNSKRDERPSNRFKPYQHSHGSNNRIPTVNSQRDRLDQNSGTNNYSNRNRFY